MKQADLSKMLASGPALGKGVAVLHSPVACPKSEMVRLPYADNEFTYYVLGHADSYQMPEELVQRLDLEEDTRDLDIVYGAIESLRGTGEKVTVNSVTALVPFGRTKVSELMKKLK